MLIFGRMRVACLQTSELFSQAVIKLFNVVAGSSQEPDELLSWRGSIIDEGLLLSSFLLIRAKAFSHATVAFLG